MSKLPAGWSSSALAGLVETVRGVTYNKSQARDSGGKGLTPILRANNIKSGNLTFDDLVYVPEECVSSTQTLSHGDIVVAMSSGSRSVVGKTAQLTAPWQGSFGAFCGVLRTATEMDPRYLYYFTQSRTYRDRVSELAAGVNINNLKPAHFEHIPVPIAPLQEQKRIAQKLDALLAQVDTLKARIDAIPALLNRFRESALNAAVSGRLAATNELSATSEETIELNERVRSISVEELAHALEIIGEKFPDRWPVYALEQLVDPERGIPYGIVQTGEHIDGGVPTVRCGDIRQLKIDTSALKQVAPSIEANYQRTRLKGGEILLAIRGSVGNTAIAPSSLAGCNISREVAMIPCTADVDSRFVALTLQSHRGQQLLAGKTRGVAQKGINLADVRRLPMALPALAKQRQIVHCIEQLFAFADQLEAKVSAAQKRIDALTQSLLAKAFRGELVPQDPNDEPASVLLERIRAQRAAAPKPKRGRKATAS